MHSNQRHLQFSRRLALLGLLGALAIPVTSTATTPTLAGEPAPIAAADDDCEKTKISLEIDVATGYVYVLDDSGNGTLLQGDLDAYFEDLTGVIIDVQYTSGEWYVIVTPDGQSPTTIQTVNGRVRYMIHDSYSSYVFSSVQASTASASTTMNMTPVVPDIVIVPKKKCPPPT